MRVSGVIVHVRVADAVEVSERLEALPGVEVHGGLEEGRLIVTIESDGRDGSDGPDRPDAQADATRAFEQVSRTPGVLSAALVYHHDEPVDG